jgi:phage shock protein A
MKNISESEFKRKIEKIENEKEIENILKNGIGEFKNILKSEFKNEIEKWKTLFRNLKHKLKLRKKEKQFWKTFRKY